MANLGQLSWGYHGDDGAFFERLKGRRYDVEWFPYGQGDTVGCAIDFSKAEIFYTRNGKRLGKRHYRPENCSLISIVKTALTDVKGRLCPVVGLDDLVDIYTNFGKEKFLWGPGNDLDFDVDIPINRAEEGDT